MTPDDKPDIEKGPEGDGMEAPGTFNAKLKNTRRSKKPSFSVLRAVFRATGGNITLSGDKFGVDPSTVNRWIRDDHRIEAAWQEGRDKVVDVSESVVWHHLKAKNLTAAIFTLKCLGWKRGWVENHREEANADPRAREERDSIVRAAMANPETQKAADALLASVYNSSVRVVTPTDKEKAN